MNTIIIEKDNVINNINLIKQKAQNAKVIAVIKANSYGVGNDIMPNLLLENGIDFFAVSEVLEGVELRNRGYSNDILILNSTCIPEEADLIINNNLIAAVGSFESLDILVNRCQALNKTVRAHIKIDTGLSRFGFIADKLRDEKNFNEFVSRLKDLDVVQITGAYTHFQESFSKNTKRTFEQFSKFQMVTTKLKEAGFNLLCHCSNSAALFKYPNMNLDAVRVGSAFSGRLVIPEAIGLKRVGYLETQICEIKELPKGSKIGYSGTCKLKKDTKVGICEAGYYDGISVTGPHDGVRVIDKMRNLYHSLLAFFKDENKYVVVNGKKVKILGRVLMKNIVIDLSNVDASIGNKVMVNINLVQANQLVPRQLV